MAKKKNTKNKNKKNNSPAVAPKAKFSTPEKKAEKSKSEVKITPEKAQKTTNTKAVTKNMSDLLEKIKAHKLPIIISAAALVLIVALVIILIVLFGGRVPELAVSEYNGQNATVSVVSDITVDEETQLERYKEIKRKIKGDKSKFKFYARPVIEIDEKYKEGTIMFSNLTMNDCTMIVTIMDEEEDIIFRSMGIAPGKCMQRIGLTKSLTFGVHEVTMYVTAYDSKTFEVIGTQHMKLELMYGDEYSASEEAELSTSETTTNPSITRPVQATQATVITTVPTTTTTTEKTEPSDNTESTLAAESETTTQKKSESTTNAKPEKTTINPKTTKRVVKTTKKAS